MTFSIKVRGARGLVLADFRCPEHSVFEALADRDADAIACPACGASSPWSPAAVFGRVQLVSAVQGKAAPKPHKMSLDLRDVGEGRSLNDWKKERRKAWRDHDYKRRKDKGLIP
jgi:hypothetical protein